LNKTSLVGKSITERGVYMKNVNFNAEGNIFNLVTGYEWEDRNYFILEHLENPLSEIEETTNNGVVKRVVYEWERGPLRFVITEEERLQKYCMEFFVFGYSVDKHCWDDGKFCDVKDKSDIGLPIGVLVRLKHRELCVDMDTFQVSYKVEVFTVVKVGPYERENKLGDVNIAFP